MTRTKIKITRIEFKNRNQFIASVILFLVFLSIGFGMTPDHNSVGGIASLVWMISVLFFPFYAVLGCLQIKTYTVNAEEIKQ